MADGQAHVVVGGFVQHLAQQPQRPLPGHPALHLPAPQMVDRQACAQRDVDHVAVLPARLAQVFQRLDGRHIAGVGERAHAAVDGVTHRLEVQRRAGAGLGHTGQRGVAGQRRAWPPVDEEDRLRAGHVLDREQDDLVQIAQPDVPDEVGQKLAHRGLVIHVTQPVPEDDRLPVLVEDHFHKAVVQLDHLGGVAPGGDAGGQQRADARPADEVKQAINRLAGGLFQPAQDHQGDDAPRPAPVNRQQGLPVLRVELDRHRASP